VPSQYALDHPTTPRLERNTLCVQIRQGEEVNVRGLDPVRPRRLVWRYQVAEEHEPDGASGIPQRRSADERSDLDRDAGLLTRFAYGRLVRALAALDKAPRDSPKASQATLRFSDEKATVRRQHDSTGAQDVARRKIHVGRHSPDRTGGATASLIAGSVPLARIRSGRANFSGAAPELA
jgi:hypothetical protein